MSIKILIVEDELIIAEDMKAMLQQIGYEVMGIVLSYAEALTFIRKSTPDIILVDINLGSSKDGIELAEYINRNYSIPLIFATSNTDPATLERAKTVISHGYLLKPFTKDDLYTSIEIAIANFQNEQKKQPKLKEYTFIKDKSLFVKVKMSDVLFLKSDGNYTDIQTPNKTFVVRGTVKDIFDELDNRFLRIHKSFVVNLEKIDAIAASHIVVNEQKIPIGKIFKEQLLNSVNMLK